ncbi:hypothetical protein CCR97_15730 [Rhodoplanes elegans]|uniref:Uncharacterized protein n=1 Tax=Rhodoplanes elegans TaxID=29408 RepID=A0A327JWC4_9BRAD|nr:hypothetical protein [Rhodoplanes elegans]MBK5959644.1 hypothetical protein [Rhodoplanes elegans]RAI30351.1 hypothetical protein CH338_27865 [Rhodoplanes elegans]
MTVRTAKIALTALWGVAIMPLLLILILRQLNGFYGSEAQAAWTWVAQYVFPGMTLIGGAWTVTDHPEDAEKRASTVVVWGALVLSAFYLLVLYLVLGAQARGSLEDVLQGSGLFLGLIQGVVVGWLGKFFIEAKR